MDNIIEQEDDRTWVPDGDYILKCINAKKITYRLPSGGKRIGVEKILLHFRIFEGDYAGKILPMYLRLGEDGHIPRGSHYYFSWFIANNSLPPERRRLKEMPCSIFVGRIFEGHVGTVKQVWGEHELPEGLKYSKVEVIYELLLQKPGE